MNIKSVHAKHETVDSFTFISFVYILESPVTLSERKAPRLTTNHLRFQLYQIGN
jgi:hypothetical protein